MGSCCSIQDDESEPRRPVPIPESRTVVVNTAFLVTDAHRVQSNDACYGEYTCTRCHRFWRSTLSRHNEYQICKKCTTRVYPKNQRDVRPEDLKRGKGADTEHLRELCQRCRQLGRYCGDYNKGANFAVKRINNNKNVYRYRRRS